MRDERVEEHALHGVGDEHQHRHDQHERDERVDAEVPGERVADVAPADQELAVREVDEPHDAEDERQAERDGRVQAAEEDAVDELVHHRGPMGWGATMRSRPNPRAYPPSRVRGSAPGACRHP